MKRPGVRLARYLLNIGVKTETSRGWISWVEHPQESGEMTDARSSHVDDDHRLRFACACATAVPVAEDPWVAIVNQRKLNDGTKERILNAIYRQPRTITQLAELLGISAPAVHRHISDMLGDELIQEVDLAAPERSRGSERYYRPNFPVVLAGDHAMLQLVLEDLAADIAAAFRRRQNALPNAFAQTSLPARGEAFETMLHYIYATATRLARERLEAAGELPPWPEHADGSRWVWWAEEAPETEVL
jgi:DNA-binding transcriptional ArsR family regulator